MAAHRAQWPEALKQEVHVRFRNHCELVNVLSNVKPGPAGAEGGEGMMGTVRGDTPPSRPRHPPLPLFSVEQWQR